MQEIQPVNNKTVTQVWCSVWCRQRDLGQWDAVICTESNTIHTIWWHHLQQMCLWLVHKDNTTVIKKTVPQCSACFRCLLLMEWVCESMCICIYTCTHRPKRLGRWKINPLVKHFITSLNNKLPFCVTYTYVESLPTECSRSLHDLWDLFTKQKI